MKINRFQFYSTVALVAAFGSLLRPGPAGPGRQSHSAEQSGAQEQSASIQGSSARQTSEAHGDSSSATGSRCWCWRITGCR